MKYFKRLGVEFFRGEHGTTIDAFGKIKYVRMGSIAKLDFFRWTPYKKVGRAVYILGFVFNGNIKGERYFCRYVG